MKTVLFRTGKGEERGGGGGGGGDVHTPITSPWLWLCFVQVKTLTLSKKHAGDRSRGTQKEEEGKMGPLLCKSRHESRRFGEETCFRHAGLIFFSNKEEH